MENPEVELLRKENALLRRVIQILTQISLFEAASIRAAGHAIDELLQEEGMCPRGN